MQKTRGSHVPHHVLSTIGNTSFQVINKDYKSNEFTLSGSKGRLWLKKLGY